MAAVVQAACPMHKACKHFLSQARSQATHVAPPHDRDRTTSLQQARVEQTLRV